MICKIIIDPQVEESIVIHVKERTALVDEIEKLVSNNDGPLVGYSDNSIYSIDMREVHCFAIEDGKIYAFTQDKKLWIKARLYSLETVLSKDFIKINQSCIANVKQIEKFESTFGGALLVVFKNGRKDYVSRRQLKSVKERIGFNL